MTNKKKIKDYINLSMRKLKHRKGFGVHSPFAYSIITEVIEEKIPYYAYNAMKPLYGKQSPIPFKVACLLLRLANRFRCRTIAEIGCDGGYSMLPILLTDSRNHVHSITEQPIANEIASRLKLFGIQESQYSIHVDNTLPTEPESFDMLILNSNPFAAKQGSVMNPEAAAQQLVEWITTHLHADSLIFVNGIQARQPLEAFWDKLCDREDISITMDLYNSGIAIAKPNFFKQHYIVSF